MKKNYRTLAAISVLALGTVAAHAQSQGAYGESSNYPVTQSAASTLTRSAVQAELASARANGTMPHDSEAFDGTLVSQVQGSRSRTEVRNEAIAANRLASRSDRTINGEY
jgi:hypothetical protein